MYLITSTLGSVCCLEIVRLGPPLKSSSDIETHYFLQIINDQLDIYRGRPLAESAKGFDETKYDVRVSLEPIPWHPLDGSLAVEALSHLEGLVLANGAREMIALVECDAMALGRIKVRIEQREPESKNKKRGSG